MNLTNKMAMVHGWGGAYVGDTPTVVLSDGTKIPAIHEHDGPQGVGNGNRDVTAWPSALTVVQSWDIELMYAYGAAMGREQYGKGSNVMLGPGVNLARLPWNGRNFEYQVRDCAPPPHPPSSRTLTPLLTLPHVRKITGRGPMACLQDGGVRGARNPGSKCISLRETLCIQQRGV